MTPTLVHPRIAIVATGGTIAGLTVTAGSTTDYRAGVLGADSLVASAPGIDELADIRVESLAQLDSKDMSHALWLALTARVADLLARPEIDGVVVTHGTDTLEETAWWLALTVASPKPVVLTGAMRAADALSPDGPLNLYEAVAVAASPAARGRGVLVAFAGRIHAAARVAKVSASAVDAFGSGDAGIEGVVRGATVEFVRAAEGGGAGDDAGVGSAAPRHYDMHGLTADALPYVEIVTSHAGASGAVISALVAAGVEGVVIAGTGNGSVHGEIEAALAGPVADGLRVMLASRIGGGAVLRNGLPPGWTSAGALSAVKARISLMLEIACGD